MVIDLHGASHLDPEVLLDLRRLVGLQTPAAPGAGTAAGRAVPPRAGRAGRTANLPPARGRRRRSPAGGRRRARSSPGSTWGRTPDPTTGWRDADSPLAAETGGVLDLDSINGLALSEYFEGTLDPAATVRALSDTALCQLADALYRHLDTSSPSFGAHTWYELAAEELQNRHLTGGDGPAGGRTGAGHGRGLSRAAARLSL